MKNIPRKLTFTADKRLLASLSLIVFLSSLMANLYQPRKHIDSALFRYGTPLQRTNLEAPTNLQIIPNDESMTLSWENPNSIENGLYFSVQGSEMPSTDFEEIITSQDTTYTDSDISAMMKLYRVNANYDGVEALVLPDYPTEITFAEDNQIEIPLSQIVSNPDDIIDAGIDNAQFGTYFDEENRSIFVIPPQDQHGEFNLNLVLNISQVPITFIIDPMCDISLKLQNVEKMMRNQSLPDWNDDFKARIIMSYGTITDSLETNDLGDISFQKDLSDFPQDENGDPYINLLKVYSIDSLGVRDSYISNFQNIRLKADFFVENQNNNNQDLEKVIEIPVQRYVNVIAGYENPELQAHQYLAYQTNVPYDFTTLNGTPAEFFNYIGVNSGYRFRGLDYQRIQNPTTNDDHTFGHLLQIDFDTYGVFIEENRAFLLELIDRIEEVYIPEEYRVPKLIDEQGPGGDFEFDPYQQGTSIVYKHQNPGCFIGYTFTSYSKINKIFITLYNGLNHQPLLTEIGEVESLDNIFADIAPDNRVFGAYSEEMFSFYISTTGGPRFSRNVKSLLQELNGAGCLMPADERLLASNLYRCYLPSELSLNGNENMLVEKNDRILMTYNGINYTDELFQIDDIGVRNSNVNK